MSYFNKNYRIAFGLAVILHGLLFGAMGYPWRTKAISFTLEAALNKPQPVNPKSQEIIQAVSIDSKDVEAQMKAIQAEREKVRLKEKQRQEAIVKAEKRAEEQRKQEARKLAQLKAEQAKLAAKQKAEIKAEQERLNQIKAQKVAEAKRIEALKKEQIELKKAQEEETARLKAENEAQQRKEEAANRARMAGIVDKYKALILNAIGDQWILPDSVNPKLSSQFKIRLAPNGSVLEVRLTKSSGDPILDRSAEAAIYKASPLPVPTDAQSFQLFREISLTVRPESVRG